MPLPGGDGTGRRNKQTIINFMKNIEPDDVSEYDTIRSYYGIIDDDNDRLADNQDKRQAYNCIKNLLALKRYSHGNYILDPVNIYFYFRSLKDNTENVEINANAITSQINANAITSQNRGTTITLTHWP